MNKLVRLQNAAAHVMFEKVAVTMVNVCVGPIEGSCCACTFNGTLHERFMSLPASINSLSYLALRREPSLQAHFSITVIDNQTTGSNLGQKKNKNETAQCFCKLH